MNKTKENSNRVGMYYRALSDAEESQVYEIKQRGEDFLDTLEDMGDSDEMRRARARIEEAVMWAVKHVTS